MAILIPDQPKESPYGERRVYEKLGHDLDAEWVVLHSLGLHGHETKLWGEADIVVLSTKGFFALEVKGGKVSCANGVWQFGEPGGASYTKREDPWTQSKGTMYAVRECLVKADKSFEEMLFGFGVVMPMETFTTTGAEIEPAVLLDKREFGRSLSFYIGQLQRHWLSVHEAKHGRKPRMPVRDDIRRARQILRPDIESALSIGSYLNSVDAKLLQLSNDQVRASRRMAANPRTIVRGKAGTGKTVIAVERAKQLAAGGHRVLYLCFNQLLARHMQIALEGDPRAAGIEIRHVHALYREVIGRAGLQHRLEGAASEQQLFAEVFPRTFLEAAFECGLPAWDALVIDEAQDLLTPDNIDAFDFILGGPGINHGRWHIFFDRLQNIYDSDIQSQVERRLAEAQPAFDDLFENCRNTRQAAVQASIVSGIDLAIDGAPDGPECGNIYYRDQKAFVARIDEVVAGLIKHDVLPHDIAVLSTRRRGNSMVADVAKLAGVPLINADDAGKGDMVFSTMHGFKGLERKVVLAIDMEEVGQRQWAMLHYAGLSRACGLLHVFLPESARPDYDRQVAAHAVRLAKA